MRGDGIGLDEKRRDEEIYVRSWNQYKFEFVIDIHGWTKYAL